MVVYQQLPESKPGVARIVAIVEAVQVVNQIPLCESIPFQADDQPDSIFDEVFNLVLGHGSFYFFGEGGVTILKLAG